jgi:uncharacterized protein YdaU (DUF1376 family)
MSGPLWAVFRSRNKTERPSAKGLNYYPHHIGDYARDTAHLSMLEDCAYRRMLDLCYASEKPLPLDRPKLYRLLRVKTNQEKQAVDIVLGEFFIEGEDGWHQRRVEEELNKVKSKSSKARASAEMRWHCERIANASKPHTEGNAPNNQEPIANNQKPKKEEVALRLPEWLPLENWKAFLEVRKKNKAPNTPRALQLALTELERIKSLGHDPALVLDQSTLKGWKSVYPLKPEIVAAVSEPAARLCDYCTKPSGGTVNGRRACDGHWHLAMANERPDPIPRMRGIEAKPVAGA